MRKLGKGKDGPSSTEIDCSSSSSDYSYYIERCYDELTQWWINGHCINGVKDEVSELHQCRKSDGSRSYCHDCTDPSSKSSSAGNSKHVCGSDSPDYDEACGIAWAATAEDCGDERLKAYSHQCSMASNESNDESSSSSWYLRESIYCNEAKVYKTGPDTFTCGQEWYYAFKEDEHESGEEHPFVSADNKYCLDCGLAIQVCAKDGDATCVSLGLLPPNKGGEDGGDGATMDALDATAMEHNDIYGSTPWLDNDQLEEVVEEGHAVMNEEEVESEEVTYYPNSHRSAWVTHGAVGVITFGLLVPLAIIPTYKYWMCITGCINVLPFVMTFFTVGTAISTMNGMGEAGEGHFKESHHVVGLLLLLLVSFQTGYGFFLHRPTPMQQEFIANDDEQQHGTTTIHNGTRPRPTMNEKSTTSLILWLFLFALGAYQAQSGVALFAKRYRTPDWGNIYICYTVWLAAVMLIGKLCMIWKDRKMKRYDDTEIQMGRSDGGGGAYDTENDLMVAHFESSETNRLKW